MIRILTVCGNGIGSSVLLKMKVEDVCEEQGIQAEVESSDVHSAQGKDSDIIVTVKELTGHFQGKRVAVVRSFVNREKIREDLLPLIQEMEKSM